MIDLLAAAFLSRDQACSRAYFCHACLAASAETRNVLSLWRFTFRKLASALGRRKLPLRFARHLSWLCFTEGHGCPTPLRLG